MNWIFPPACCLERFPSLKESQWNQVVSMRRTDRVENMVRLSEWLEFAQYRKRNRELRGESTSENSKDFSSSLQLRTDQHIQVRKLLQGRGWGKDLLERSRHKKPQRTDKFKNILCFQQSEWKNLKIQNRKYTMQVQNIQRALLQYSVQ